MGDCWLRCAPWSASCCSGATDLAGGMGLLLRAKSTAGMPAARKQPRVWVLCTPSNLRPCERSNSGALVPLPVRLRYATRPCCLTNRMSGEGLRSRLAARFKRFSRSATSTQSPNAPAGRLPSGRFVRRKVHVTVSFRPQMMPKNPPLIRWGGYTHGCLSLHGRLPPAVASACASRRPCWHWPF